MQMYSIKMLALKVESHGAVMVPTGSRPAEELNRDSTTKTHYVIIKHFISKPWTLIRCHTLLLWSFWKPTAGFSPIQHKSITEIKHIRYGYWAIRPGLLEIQLIPNVWWDWGQGSVQACQALLHQSGKITSVWTSLCAEGHCCVEMGFCRRQTFLKKLVIKISVCAVPLRFPKFELRSLAQTIKNSCRPKCPHTSGHTMDLSDTNMWILEILIHGVNERLSRGESYHYHDYYY